MELSFTPILNAVGALLLVTAATLLLALRRKAQKPIRSSGKTGNPNDMRVPENQLRVIRENAFSAQKPINTEAFRKIYRPVERYLQNHQPNFRLLAEVGMGGFIQAGEKGASQKKRKFLYAAYGSKRVDFLIINSLGHPALAIEYQGTGHSLGKDTVKHDQVKRAVLLAAGIPQIEVLATTTASELIEDIAGRIGGNKIKLEEPARGTD